jgi:hypothetical protein
MNGHWTDYSGEFDYHQGVAGLGVSVCPSTLEKSVRRNP